MDNMREEFEGWATSCHMCTYFDDVEYRHQSTEWAWKAWKASRAALCVELPKYDNGDVYSDTWAICRSVMDDFETAIDESGVSYK